MFDWGVKEERLLFDKRAVKVIAADNRQNHRFGTGNEHPSTFTGRVYKWLGLKKYTCPSISRFNTLLVYKVGILSSDLKRPEMTNFGIITDRLVRYTFSGFKFYNVCSSNQ